MTAVCMLHSQTVHSVLAADVVGNTSGLNSNDTSQYVIPVMSDAPFLLTQLMWGLQLYE